MTKSPGDSISSADDPTVAANLEDSPLASFPEVEVLAPGHMIGNYRVEGELGSGGFAHVYKVEHTILKNRFALKLLNRKHIGTQMQTRFVREVQAVQAIRHPNLVEIFDLACTMDGRPYYVMELLSGTNLRNVVRARGRLSIGQTIPIVSAVCHALAAAHARGIIHRDVKASNIMLLEGPENRVKLLDFGIAKFLDLAGEGLTGKDMLLGSSQVMAPEQIRGQAIDQRTDIYALGIVLFHLLTGRLPFNAGDGDVQHLHLSAEAPRPSTFAPIPAALDAIVSRCLEKEPEHRYQEVQEILDALTKVSNQLTQVEKSHTSTIQAVGVYVEISPAEGLEDDELTLLAIADVNERVEEVLRAAAFQICMQSGSAVLGVAPIPEFDEQARDVCQKAKDAAQAITEIAETTDQLLLRVRIHSDDAVPCESGDITGGRILCPEQWPKEPSSGRCDALS